MAHTTDPEVAQKWLSKCQRDTIAFSIDPTHIPGHLYFCIIVGKTAIFRVLMTADELVEAGLAIAASATKEKNNAEEPI